MTHISFYILSDASVMSRIHYACRLTEKAFSKGHKITISVDNTSVAQEVSHALHHFKPESFIPHNLQGETGTAPVHLIWDLENHGHYDVLINLSHQVPNGFSRYKRLLEVVVQEESCLKATREHFQFYRDRGYPLDNHKIST